jgi:gliding motility-associated-like protein
MFSARLHIITLLLLTPFVVRSQSYFANGDARSIGGQCYELTSAKNFQLGSVWYADKIDLSKDFDLEFYLNFGSNDHGADGIVFVMQTVGNRAIGGSGGGLGFDGFSPSFGVEFDTYYNAVSGDPNYDHIAILQNGSINHNGSNTLTPAKAALPTLGNIEDGKDHLVRIQWQADNKTIAVWFDCELRHTLTYDIQNKIFDGTSEVFWGFTGATGGAVNRQIACLRDDILIPDTIAICKGDSKRLNARKSSDGSYLWSPTSFLDNPTQQNPLCNTTTPIQYTVKYKDLCGEEEFDTIDVVIHQPFIMDEIEDSLLCDGRPYRVNLAGRYDSARWENNSRPLVRSLTQAGSYRLRAWKGVCYDDDSAVITTLRSPTIEFSGDSVFCENETTTVDVTITPDNTSFEWDDGSMAISREFKTSASHFVTAENACNSTIRGYSVRQILVSPVNIGNDTMGCQGDDIMLKPDVRPNKIYSWDHGPTTPNIDISLPGQYILTVSEKHCSASDTIRIDFIEPPSISLPDTVKLCKNEKLLVRRSVPDASVTWQKTVTADSLLLFNYEGDLTVNTRNKCGEDSALAYVPLVDCYCRLFIPNAVSPNYDELNEVFQPVADCDKLKTYRLTVYNRWGQQVFTSDSPDKVWNMEVKNSQAPAGIYIWHVVYSGFENGQIMRKTDKGTLHVLR